MQFEREMKAKQQANGAKDQDVKEYEQFVSALTDGSGVWMTASYLNHCCLGSFFHLPFLFASIVNWNFLQQNLLEKFNESISERKNIKSRNECN